LTQKPRADHRLKAGPPPFSGADCRAKRVRFQTCPVDRLVQSEAIKLYPGWSKVVGAPLALYEPRTWISDLAREGDRTPEPRNVQGRCFDVTRMPHRKAIFQRTVIDSAVDQPDSLFGELTKGSRPARAGQHRKVSTPVSGSDFARSTSGSRVPTWSVAKAWTPTQSTSAACVLVGTRATELRPVRFHGRWPPRGVAVTMALCAVRATVHLSRELLAAATCRSALSSVPQWLVSPP